MATFNNGVITYSFAPNLYDQFNDFRNASYANGTYSREYEVFISGGSLKPPFPREPYEIRDQKKLYLEPQFKLDTIALEQRFLATNPTP